MNKVLVTPRSLTRSGHPALEKIEDAGFELLFCTRGKMPGEDELLELVPGCVGYLAGVEKISRRVLEAADQLKVISRNGTGIDNIDMEAARECGIEVARAVGANAQGVAELAIALLFAVFRRLTSNNAAVKAGRWERQRGVEVKGKTVGIIGCGHIGGRVAELAAGIGMNVLGYDAYPDEEGAQGAAFRYVSLDQLLKESDVITLHCPALEDGKALINREALGRMKKGVYLINTARSSLVDDDVLLEALESGQVEGFATDVYEQEPPQQSRLLQHEKVITTPHIGGYTEESVARATEAAVDNILQWVVE
jgi:D-3-phosphoglycerate dehydrogenase